MGSSPWRAVGVALDRCGSESIHPEATGPCLSEADSAHDYCLCVIGEQRLMGPPVTTFTTFKYASLIPSDVRLSKQAADGAQGRNPRTKQHVPTPNGSRHRVTGIASGVPEARRDPAAHAIYFLWNYLESDRGFCVDHNVVRRPRYRHNDERPTTTWRDEMRCASRRQSPFSGSE
jgi:hypothetical protein